MSSVDVRVVDVGGPPAFPELIDKDMVNGTLSRVAVLQAGMESGKASIGLLIDLPNGDVVFVQISAEMLDMINGVSVGARQRWGEIAR